MVAESGCWEKAIANIEALMNSKFGDLANPLLDLVAQLS